LVDPVILMNSYISVHDIFLLSIVLGVTLLGSGIYAVLGHKARPNIPGLGGNAMLCTAGLIICVAGIAALGIEALVT